MKETRENLRTENEKLAAELEELIANTEHLENDMAKAVKAEETRHAKEIENLKKANQVIKVRVARLTRTLFY